MKKKKRIQDTEDWKIAEFEYEGLLAQRMFPFFGTPLTNEEIIEILKDILKDCSEYYPAQLELGYRYIKEGKDDIGKEFLDKGLSSIKKHFSPKVLKDALYQICEFLEDHYRFEMAIDYYNLLIDVEKDKAKIYDYTSYCYAYLGDIEKAIEAEKKALELCDTNYMFYSNMAWLEMIRGNLKSAKEMLKKSINLNGSDKISQNNYNICNYMIKSENIKNWESYLLREKDLEYLRQIDDEEFEREVISYNNDKIEAFKFYISRNPKFTPARRYDIMFTLKYVFDVISRMYNGGFFCDDIYNLNEDFKEIMYKIILETKDIDSEILNDMYDALLNFYKFLSEKGVAKGYNSLEDKMLKFKPKLLEKIEKYDNVRNNDGYTDEEKREFRKRLIEMD